MFKRTCYIRLSLSWLYCSVFLNVWTVFHFFIFRSTHIFHWYSPWWLKICNGWSRWGYNILSQNWSSHLFLSLNKICYTQICLITKSSGSRNITCDCLSVKGEDSGRIVVWNMAPVVSEKIENDENVPKMLCQMDNHLGE